jgi:phosphate transport system ATP-binding protein
MQTPVQTASLETRNLSVYYGSHRAVCDVTIAFKPFEVTALIGPSGCGKTTLLRALNRIHETAPGGRVTGEVLLDRRNVYDPEVNVTSLRRRVGMVFQRANPFPTLSILENVLSGLPNRPPEPERKEIAEQALRAVALWDEVKDRLRASPLLLSGGQQQRLCIARAIAVEPEVLLMDEPTSALDPISTASIEELVRELAQRYTMVIVTHNMQQAARVSDVTAFMLAEEDRCGRLIEVNDTRTLFFKPADVRTENYITGRFG